MSDVIATTGPRLKAERERRGLSSQKAADELHLDGWVIDALEAEDYERIGPSVYAKGHLKRYAALLGLPSAEIVAGYESRVQAPKPPASQQPSNVRLRTDAPVVSGLPWPQIAMTVAAVLLAVGVLWWRPWHHRATGPVNSAPVSASPGAARSDSAADSAADAATPAAASPAPPSASQAMASSQLPPPGASAANPATQAPPSEADAPGAGRAHLRLSFSADSWVDVHDAAGRRAFAGNGRANSVRNIDGLAPMRVYLGFASGVQLEINNRAVAIGPQFVAGDVARFEAGADGVLRRDSRNAAASGPPTRSARPSN
jgi:cytoskeleton protein RodZ